MKKLLFILALVLVCSVGYAQELTEKIDWDKVDLHLFKEAKAGVEKTDAEIHQAIGHAHLKLYNNWERATVHFKKAVELDPQLFFSWFRLGLIYIDTEEGNEYFRQASKVEPDNPQPYYWLAYTHCRFGRLKEALPVLEKYVDLAKGDANEEDRLEFASKLLEEVRSGKEGKAIKGIKIHDE